MPENQRLDRSNWHRPLVSVIVTHFDYSDYLEDALFSIADQSYGNVECVVVDDGSSPQHRKKARNIVNHFASDRVLFLDLETNVGQVNAFYAGLDKTSGEFVCLLDPDDRYAKTFVENLVSAHLNSSLYGPLASCEQYKMTKSGVINSTDFMTNVKNLKQRLPTRRISTKAGHATYFSPFLGGWFWTSTSALMFRRAALKFLRPVKELSYKKEADVYLGCGAHMLGGTIFLEAPLVYRVLHERNAWIKRDIFSIEQIKYNSQGPDVFDLCRRNAALSILENGARESFSDDFLRSVLYASFGTKQLSLLRAESKTAADLIPAGLPGWRRRLAQQLDRHGWSKTHRA
jgi:glycosyltransferase involved in cell wall biosynthesis